MSNIENLATFDPFADEGEEISSTDNRIHIRIQQRNGRKSVTTIQGLSSELDLKRILKAFKKNFNCNGTIVTVEEKPELGEVIQLQGDHRREVQQFLIDEQISRKENIKIHGF
eukprot:TRINITY_DN853_c0_g1_i1.p1 TRINITY_DN853_c0_g1~~TRINITY_DN853_c0_g1_i1.p1  ORF type:complete len:113 (-),score=42.19 TRINITY_DN853_c0_g1_i1:210-548(-)